MSMDGNAEDALDQRDVSWGHDVTSVLWKRALGPDFAPDGYLSSSAWASVRHCRSARRTEQPFVRSRRAKARLMPGRLRSATREIRDLVV